MLNFLSTIGKKYQGSGLYDLLIESGVYAAGTTSALLAGRSYFTLHLHLLRFATLQ